MIEAFRFLPLATARRRRFFLCFQTLNTSSNNNFKVFLIEFERKISKNSARNSVIYTSLAYTLNSLFRAGKSVGDTEPKH